MTDANLSRFRVLRMLLIIGAAAVLVLVGYGVAMIVPLGANSVAEEDEPHMPAPRPTLEAPAAIGPSEEPAPQEEEEEDPDEEPQEQPAIQTPQQPAPPLIHYFRAPASTVPVDCTGYENGGWGGEVEWSTSRAVDGTGVLLRGAGADPYALPIYTEDLPANGFSGVYVDCVPGSPLTTYTLLVVDIYGREATATFTFERYYR